MENISKIKLIEKILPELESIMTCCRLCPRECGVNRLKGEKGACHCGQDAVVYTSMPHNGEEPPISGKRGSGTIFFSGCGMKCVYCQNHQFSQSVEGKGISARRLGEMMLELEAMGCHNINLVNPTYFLPAILDGLRHAFSLGLALPVVYNTGGYDSAEVIKKLNGVIDIYLPDMRYSKNDMAERYSGVKGYVEVNREVIKEMYRQVGELKVASGVAVKGLIIRLLALPGGVSGTEDSLGFISRELGKNVSISLMSQYYPAYRASSHKEIDRKITSAEYERVVEKCEELGLGAGWIQPFGENFDTNLHGENFKPAL